MNLLPEDSKLLAELCDRHGVSQSAQIIDRTHLGPLFLRSKW